MARLVLGHADPDCDDDRRRVALDAETMLVLTEHRDRCRARAADLGIDLTDDAFVFSGAPDGSRFLAPGSVSQRYDRLATRLKIKTTLRKPPLRSQEEANTVSGHPGTRPASPP
jgi:hypothetical protein